MTTQLEPQWIVGFVDGNARNQEGCFNLDVHINNSTRWKIQMQPEFTVVQGDVDVQVLHAMKEYFGCGTVSEYKNKVNRFVSCIKDHTSTRTQEKSMMYRVKNIEDLDTKIVPFFEKHKLKTKKGVEFKRFRDIVRKMKAGYHRDSLQNFLEIVELGEKLRFCRLRCRFQGNSSWARTCPCQERVSVKRTKVNAQLIALRLMLEQNRSDSVNIESGLY